MGATVSPADTGFVDSAVALERLGFGALSVVGGPMHSLDQLASVVGRPSGRP